MSTGCSAREAARDAAQGMAQAGVMGLATNR